MIDKSFNYLAFTLGHQVRCNLSHILFYMEGGGPPRFITVKFFEFLAHFGATSH